MTETIVEGIPHRCTALKFNIGQRLPTRHTDASINEHRATEFSAASVAILFCRK